MDRRPGQLSGGQQQRVAMGRAIVREPAAFLMDEPLSNLDAKLRVGMRTSLQQLHARLGTTTIYVTHDQVEAMTLGQRVAVMSDGRIQQVDPPQRLYEDPTNLFVGGFHRLAGDEPDRDERRRRRDRPRRAVGSPRPSAPAAVRRRRQGDRRHPAGGVRGRRVRPLVAATGRGQDRGDRGARLGRAPLLPPRRRQAGAVSKRPGRAKRTTRRRCSPTAATRSSPPGSTRARPRESATPSGLQSIRPASTSSHLRRARRCFAPRPSAPAMARRAPEVTDS